MEAWKIIFLSKWVICRLQPLIFQGVSPNPNPPPNTSQPFWHPKAPSPPEDPLDMEDAADEPPAWEP